MSVIVQWVTQIVIFILIATIVDLLIPANSMKKYIQFVIGLILILIFLKPIFYILDIDFKHTLTASISEVMQNQDAEKIENLIDSQKSEIESTQNAYILEQMAVQLKDLANPSLKEEHQVAITTVNFVFNDGQAYEFEDLEEVIVYVQDYEEEEGTVQTVEDIVINTQDPIQEEETKDTKEIEEVLREVWELYDKKLTIIWEGGAS